MTTLENKLRLRSSLGVGLRVSTPPRHDKIRRMINPQSLVHLKREQILQIAARNGVERLRVFGSVARGTEDEQSDIDFLAELAPDRSLLDLGNFLYEVRSLLGKEVDVVTEKSLQRRIRDRVLAEAVDL